MVVKKKPNERKGTNGKMATAESWRTPRKSDYGRMVEPAEIIAEMDRATRIRMADQEPVADS